MHKHKVIINLLIATGLAVLLITCRYFGYNLLCLIHNVPFHFEIGKYQENGGLVIDVVTPYANINNPSDMHNQARIVDYLAIKHRHEKIHCVVFYAKGIRPKRSKATNVFVLNLSGNNMSDDHWQIKKKP